MKFIRNLKLRRFLTNWVFWLIIITIAAIIIRSIPGWLHAAWGCDFGIYYGITKSVAQSGVLFPPYTGWGSSYNEFPVLYLINAFASWITGIDVLTIMPKLTPIFGGLAVLIFYFVAYELTTNKKIAILCTLFFAFLPFHVYQTSHASPLTMGHFFTMLSLYFYLKFRQNTKFIVPLFISTLLLIMSHHLTTYFYLLTIIGILFFENASNKEWTLTIKKDIFYILITSIFIFTYWALIAKTVFEGFMRSGLAIGGIRLESIYIILIFYILFACLFGIIIFIRKFNERLLALNSNIKSPVFKVIFRVFWRIYPFIKKKWPSKKSRLIIFFTVIFGTLGNMLYFSSTNMSWVGFSFTNLSILYAFPLVIAIACGVAGFRYTWFMKNGLFIRGWFLILLLSFIFMLITNNRTIFPHRHPEYLMAPLAILMAYGLGGIFSDPFYKGTLAKLINKKNVYVSYISKKIKISQKNRLAQLFVILIIVISLASTTYVAHKALDASDERITMEDISTIEWMSDNLDKNTSIIASDHRLARMAEAEGFNTTKDETINIWEAENLEEYIDELIGIGKNHSRITHIFVDDIMKNDVVHVHFGLIKYMTNETWTAAYDKFKQQPFELIYQNQSISINEETFEPIHWAELYQINWTYIESVI
jgi:hypothetical protein